MSLRSTAWLNAGCGVAQCRGAVWLNFEVAQCLARRPAVRHTRVQFHPRLSWRKFIYSEKEIYDLPSSGRQDNHQMRYQRDHGEGPRPLLTVETGDTHSEIDGSARLPAKVARQRPPYSGLSDWNGGKYRQVPLHRRDVLEQQRFRGFGLVN